MNGYPTGSMVEDWILHPSTLEEAINSEIYWIKLWDRPGISIVVKRTLNARIKVYETAPRDLNKLALLIAQKKKEIRGCSLPWESDVPIGEEEA